jgi:PAS domain S-box-containing protein
MQTLIRESAMPPEVGHFAEGGIDRLFFQRNPQAMWIYDQESLGILAVNNAATEKYGYSYDEMLGLRVTDVNAPEEAERLRRDLAAGLPERGQSAVWMHRRRDGRQMAVEVISHGGEYLGRTAVFVIARDVAGEQETTHSLWASEDRFRLLVEHSSDLMLVIGRDRKILYATPASDTVLGYPEGSLTGKSAFALVNPDDWAQVHQSLGDFMRTPGGRVQLDLRVRHADGHWVYLEAQGTNLLAVQSVQGVVVNTRDVTLRKTAEERVRRQVRQLRALRLIDSSITAGRSLHETAAVLLDQITACLSVDAVSFHLRDGAGENFSLVAARGFRTPRIEEAGPLALLQDAAPLLAERRMCAVQPLAAIAGPEAAWRSEDEGFVAYWGVPVLANGRVGALLEIYCRSAFEPEPGWFEFLDMLVGQAAIAIDSWRLIAELECSNQDLQASYDRTLEGWVRAVDLRDRETKGHSDRVTQLTVQLAARMGMVGEELAQIRRGALLHDIGKIAIPDEVLLKPAALTEEEWEVMRLHPLYAYEFLYPIPHLRAALDIPLYHHEKWDGSGYPYGYQGTRIPLAARLFALIDVWDALRSERPYRHPWTSERAMEHILSQSGTHFDPEIVPIFVQMIEEMSSPSHRPIEDLRA